MSGYAGSLTREEIGNVFKTRPNFQQQSTSRSRHSFTVKKIAEQMTQSSVPTRELRFGGVGVGGEAENGFGRRSSRKYNRQAGIAGLTGILVSKSVHKREDLLSRPCHRSPKSAPSYQPLQI